MRIPVKYKTLVQKTAQILDMRVSELFIRALSQDLADIYQELESETLDQAELIRSIDKKDVILSAAKESFETAKYFRQFIHAEP